ncbi:probable G-protein coupled receptor 22 [Lates japonicus]|uniref:Probable G-protein coupled receptor 22 n=1 Tax=Lates japonicus TaxID=270547 RepID=A0AAD3MZB2_LATJO|nr:probable G-protein coupled receptor 22 [Lates japonicus]
MENDSYTSGPATTDWVGTVAGIEGTGVLLEQGGGGSSSSPVSWYMPYSLGFQVSLTAFLMLELVLGFSSNLTVLVLYCSQSNLVDSVSNMVTVNLHVLDVAVCVLCLPLTLVVVLLPPGPNLALICCFHEACVTFASIATAINILVISLDRYDISVRPANRLLTTRRAALLLTAVWVTSVAVFFIPFLEVQWSSGEGSEEKGQVAPLPLSSHGISATVVPAWRNRTLLCVGGQGNHTGLGMHYHLILQVPIFFTTVAVMLFTYSRILRALNIRIGSHMKKTPRFRGPSCRGRHKRQKKKRAGLRMIDGREVGGEQCTTDGTKQLSHPPHSFPLSHPTAHLPLPVLICLWSPLTGAATSYHTTILGVQASVWPSLLRRAVRRHRDRRGARSGVLDVPNYLHHLLGLLGSLSLSSTC